METNEKLNSVSLGQPGNRIIPLTMWNDYHPHPPIGGLRHLVFFADTNGFAKVIRRMGRRIYLSEKAFFEFLDSQKKEVR